MRKTILVVEDEADIQRVLRYNLERAGYRVLQATDGEKGLALALAESPDLILLDVMLPRLDGFGFIRKLRERSAAPVLILTAKKEEVDRVLGLRLGGDDYVTKPFSVAELSARIEALLRRTRPGPVRKGPVAVDAERQEVRVRGRRVEVSPRELSILKALAEADGRVLTRRELMGGAVVDDRTVDQHVARLRRKLGAGGDRVATVLNAGYKLVLD